MIQSVAGLLAEGGLSRHRPFRRSASHLLASGAGRRRPARQAGRNLTRPSRRFIPGRAVEFSRATLEALRQPLEKLVAAVIARANAHVTYPARVQLVAGDEPVPLQAISTTRVRRAAAPPNAPSNTSRKSPGRCSTASICMSTCRAVSAADLTLPPPAETSARRRRTPSRRAARRVQRRTRDPRPRRPPPALQHRARRRTTGGTRGARAGRPPAPDRRRRPPLNPSARGYHRVLRVARTLADLGSCRRRSPVSTSPRRCLIAASRYRAGNAARRSRSRRRLQRALNPASGRDNPGHDRRAGTAPRSVLGRRAANFFERAVVDRGPKTPDLQRAAYARPDAHELNEDCSM